MTPAEKLYNWNLIVTALKSFGINIDNEVRDLIVGGDLEILADLLNQIRMKEIEFSEMLLKKESTLKTEEPVNKKDACNVV